MTEDSHFKWSPGPIMYKTVSDIKPRYSVLKTKLATSPKLQILYTLCFPGCSDEYILPVRYTLL